MCEFDQTFPSQGIQRVSERLEDSLASSGLDVSNVGKIVKQQFIALVEGQFVQRVSPCNPEVELLQHGTQEVGGVVTMTVENKFVLPSNVEGVSLLTHLPPNPSTPTHPHTHTHTHTAIRYVKGRKRQREEDGSEEPKAKKRKRYAA